MDYQNINLKIVIKTYPLPIICKTMHKLEGFQYATTSYLIVVYYTIELSSESCDIKNIVTESEKFR